MSYNCPACSAPHHPASQCRCGYNGRISAAEYDARMYRSSNTLRSNIVVTPIIPQIIPQRQVVRHVQVNHVAPRLTTQQIRTQIKNHRRFRHGDYIYITYKCETCNRSIGYLKLNLAGENVGDYNEVSNHFRTDHPRSISMKYYLKCTIYDQTFNSRDQVTMTKNYNNIDEVMNDYQLWNRVLNFWQ